MNGDTIVERKKWFRVFPEGTLEFMIITRVLALAFLIALAIVSGAQRPFVLIGLAGVLWADYALLVWWLLQLSRDLRLVRGEALSADDAAREVRASIVVLIPSAAAAVALLPWGPALSFFGLRSSLIAGTIPTVAAILFVVSLVPAYRMLRDARFSSPIWTFLLLVPILHLPASQRLAGQLGEAVREQLRARGEKPQSLHKPTAAMAVADITWVLTMLPWLVMIGVSLTRGWQSGGLFTAGPVCGTCLAGLFAISNLAAMEAIQRQMVLLVRRA